MIHAQILEAIGKHLRENYPFRVTVYPDRNTVSAWYNSTPVAQIKLEPDQIYFGYGARYYHNWPDSMVLAYEDPRLMDIIEDRLGKIEP